MSCVEIRKFIIHNLSFPAQNSSGIEDNYLPPRMSSSNELVLTSHASANIEPLLKMKGVYAYYIFIFKKITR